MELFDKSAIKADFSHAAKHYDENADLQQKVAEKVSLIANAMFDNQDKILDIGAGTGFFVKKCKNYMVFQLDIAFGMCEVCSSFSPVVNADMQFLPFKSRSFDGVVSSMALQWASDSAGVIMEIQRVLKSNGKILFSTLGNGTLKELRGAFEQVGEKNRVNNFTSAEHLFDVIEKNGFKNIKLTKKIITCEYDDVFSLMKKVKLVGAGNKHGKRKKIIKKTTLLQLFDIYNKNFGKNGKIPATWEVLYFSAIKA